jgi:F-type H+-transporting ATPase subunit b
VEEVLRETLNLIIASLPTTIIVFLFYLFARVAFFKPMMRVLDERAARTEGARSDAARLDSQAQEKLALYHRALDKVRAEIYTEQEAARRVVLDERAELLRQTRAKANERVRQEKQRLERELAGASEQVDRESVRLAENAARAVLSESAPVREPTGEL